MTDRGLPSVDGAPACPFVAFDDDRDARATSPDHRHRCYAEVRPAPRALAHQEAYCLSSAFPVCPTFQDWARREAAQARSGGGGAGGAGGGAGGVEVGPDARMDAAGDASAALPGRNPHRDWTAPPPWLGGSPDGGSADDIEIQAQPPGYRGGLAGSFADRIAAGSTAQPAGPGGGGGGHFSRPTDDNPEPDDDDDDLDAPTPSITRSPDTGRRRDRRDERRTGAGPVAGPSWERPRRMEAYPTLKARIGLPSLSPPPVLLGVAAVAIAAVALFFLPAWLGVGNTPQVSGAPTPTPAASGIAATATPFEPTPVPGPTQQIYLVQSGDTMSRIANRFGIPLQILIDANAATIPNPDVLDIGQGVIIPSVAPTSLPDAGATPSPPPS